MNLDLKRITHERDLAIVEKKQLENEIELNREKVGILLFKEDFCILLFLVFTI